MLSWDPGTLAISESGQEALRFEALDVGEFKDVLGKEALVICEDGIILGWDEVSVTGE